MATTVHDKPHMGRRPDYKEEYCQMLIDHMSQGLSYETFAAVVKTHRSTLYRWEAKYSNFRDAKQTGVEAGQLLWEKIGIAQAVGDKALGKGNVASWIFNMKNRYSWTDRTEQTQVSNERNFQLAYKVKDAEDAIETEVVPQKQIEPDPLPETSATPIPGTPSHNED